MNNKIFGIVVCMLMIATTVLPVAGTTNLSYNQLKELSVPFNDKSSVSRQTNYCLWSGSGLNLMNSAITPTIDLSGQMTCKLNLYMQYNISSPDYGAIDISTDNGGSWTRLMSFSGIQLAWKKYVIDITAYISQSVMIKFLYSTGGNSQGSGWHIDSVYIMSNNLIKPVYEEYFDSGGGSAPGWTLSGWTIFQKMSPPGETSVIEAKLYEWLYLSFYLKNNGSEYLFGLMTQINITSRFIVLGKSTTIGPQDLPAWNQTIIKSKFIFGFGPANITISGQYLAKDGTPYTFEEHFKVFIFLFVVIFLDDEG